MKRMMWAVYTTKASKMPRAMFFSRWGAEDYIKGVSWGVIVRVMVEKSEQGYFTIYHHEYRKI